MISSAKINLGLSVLYKRPDQYHELKSIFIKTSWGDDISFVSNNSGQLNLVTTNELPSDKRQFFEEVSERGNPEKNILTKTYHFLCDIIGKKVGITIQLVKRIPPGGGLGGGSSNAAQLIQYFIHTYNIKVTENLIQKISRLGADIPFFLYPGAAIVGGIGEKIKTIPISSGVGILAIPTASINTTELYSRLKKPLQKEPPEEPWDKLASGISAALIEGNWSFLQGKLVNEFEKVVFPSYPELAEIKEKFLDCGAEYSSMTGSGSCIYALCKDTADQKKVSLQMKQLLPDLHQVLFDF